MLDLRKELARQKYVNQVLWRKLDALIDIHGSNTRAELAIELANYHDELEALKARQHRVHAALSRSSSGVFRFLYKIFLLITTLSYSAHSSPLFSLSMLIIRMSNPTPKSNECLLSKIIKIWFVMDMI